MINGGKSAKIKLVEKGTYGAMQGPTFRDSGQKFRVLQRDGCTVVGMTGMPEAALARELEVAYACCAVVVNPAAGKGEGSIDMQALNDAVESSMQTAQTLIANALANFVNSHCCRKLEMADNNPVFLPGSSQHCRPQWACNNLC